MASKIAAAELASAAGVPAVIASGTGEDVLPPILAGAPRGTRFDGAPTRGSRRSSSGFASASA